MNLKNIGDLDHLKPCFKCGEFLDIEDGKFMSLERTGLTGRVNKIVNLLSGDMPKSLFVCTACKAKIRRNRILIWSLFYSLIFLTAIFIK